MMRKFICIILLACSCSWLYAQLQNPSFDADGRPCREFVQNISVDGQWEEIRATACRSSDGTWQIIDG